DAARRRREAERGLQIMLFLTGTSVWWKRRREHTRRNRPEARRHLRVGQPRLGSPHDAQPPGAPAIEPASGAVQPGMQSRLVAERREDLGRQSDGKAAERGRRDAD